MELIYPTFLFLVLLFLLICLGRIFLITSMASEALTSLYHLKDEDFYKLLKIYNKENLLDQLMSWRKWTFKQFYPEWPSLKSKHKH